MLGKKVDCLVITEFKQGIFLFEFLTGMFLLSLSLTIIWNGFLYSLKNYKAALDLYQKVTIASELVESERNFIGLKQSIKNYFIQEDSKKVHLETKKLSFDIQLITISSLNNDDLQTIELWKYCGKD